MSRFTVMGGGGFIGSRVANHLRELGHEVHMPDRSEDVPSGPLGRVIYCIGLTADFRRRPLDTVEAHVCKFARLLVGGDFEGVVYLSSTRVYGAHLEVAEEDAVLHVQSQSGSDLYNLSKLMGESLALHANRPCKVARLSNVYGGDFGSANFLSEVCRQAVTEGRVTFRTTPDSCKDYIHVDQVADLLVQISLSGTERVYNVASGVNVTNGEIAERLGREFGIPTTFSSDAARTVFPPLSTERITREFGFTPWSLTDRLRELLRLCRTHLETETISHD